MRLARALAAAGVCSRREAEARIRAGRVALNGTVITDVATNVDPLNDAIKHDGKRVYLERPTTIALYKPEGAITTVQDTHGRQTVRDLLPNVRERVYPVGRLDADASGLLLLTNDGELAYRLTHPKYEVKKTYRVWVEGRPSERALRRLARGVVLERGERPTAPARVTIVRGIKGGTVLRITIFEGRKHEIKDMCEKIGHPCTKIVREKFAGLTLSGLSPGQSRELSFKDVRKLRKLVGLEVETADVLRNLDARMTAGADEGDAKAPTPSAAETTTPRPSRPAPRRDRGTPQRRSGKRWEGRSTGTREDRGERGRTPRREAPKPAPLGPPAPPGHSGKPPRAHRDARA